MTGQRELMKNSVLSMEGRISFYSRSTRQFLFDIEIYCALAIGQNNNNVSVALCSGERNYWQASARDICRDSLRKSTNESNAKMHQPNPVIRDTLLILYH